jgi:hypothetical protein
MCNVKKMFKLPKYGLHYMASNSILTSNSKEQWLCTGTMSAGSLELLLEKVLSAPQGILSAAN